MTVDAPERPGRIAAPAGRGIGRLQGHRLFTIAAVTLTALIVLLVLYPMISMVIRELVSGGRLNTEAMDRVLSDPKFWTAVRNTVIVVGISGVLAIVIGSAFAWLNERSDARMDRVAAALPLLPLVLPNIAMCIGWIFLADKNAGILNVMLREVLSWVGINLTEGPLNIMSWPGMIFLYTVWFVSFVYILVAAALRNVEPALEEASRISGASVWMTFRLVSLKAIKPALGGACFLVLLLGVAQFSIGRTIGVTARIDVLSVYLVRLFQGYPPQQDSAVFVGLLVLALVLTAWLLERRLTSKQGHATISGKSSSPSMVRLGAFRWVARAIMILYLAAASIIPLLALIQVALQPFWTAQINFSAFSLQNFRTFFDSELFRSALAHSLTLAVAGATIGVLIAGLLVSFARFRGGSTYRIVDGVARAPGAISHVVIAVAFLVALGGSPIFLAGTLTILLMVYVLMNMPQAWIAAGQAMDQIGQPLLDASAISGATNARTFFSVNLPLMASGLTAGWAMLFIVMVGDLTASAILAGPNNPVVGSVILEVYDSGTYSQLAALGTTIAVISGAIIALVLGFAKRIGPETRVTSPV